MFSDMLAKLGRIIVPQRFRPVLRRQWLKVRHFGCARQCNLCGSLLSRFVPHGYPSEPDFLCPICRSKPPHRLAARMFEEHPEWFTQHGLMVHIAPEPELMRKLSERAQDCGMAYRCGGITGQGEFFLDLLNLPFEDGSVDLLYCCHVLNSLQDDNAAMREVFRVMRPGGVALLQVPAFYQGTTTLETNSYAERMSVFNDEGIFRCYTDADYVERLNQAGFQVRHFLASGLPPDLIRRHSLKNEVVHACYKQRSERP